MPRLTRAESQALTQRKIMDAARAAFARNGYGATSVDQIAEAAGFSKGAFYSNFATKDSLAVALAYDNVTVRLDEWSAFVKSRIPLGLESVAEAIRLGADSVSFDLDRDRLHLELALRGTRDPEVGKAVHAQIANGFEKIVEMFDTVFRGLGRIPPIETAELANLILLIHYGRKVLDIATIPHAPGPLTEAVFRALFASAARVPVPD